MTAATDMGWYNYALSYLQAARSLRTLKLRTTHRDSPVEFLYNHAIELLLKAYLVHKDVSPGVLKKLGHRVLALADECRQRGLPLSDEDQQILELVSIRGHVPRYIETGLFTRASFESLDLLASTLVYSIDKALRAAGRPMPPEIAMG